jgi:(2Fe-2S) ferredoxin
MDKREVPYRKIVFVCTNQRAPGERICCQAGGGALLRDKLKAMVKERRLRGRVRVSASGCLDRCEDGPNIMIFPDNIWYAGVCEDDLETILNNLVESLRREGALPEHYLDS